MRATGQPWLVTASVLALVIGLPVLGHLCRWGQERGCTLDGVAIHPLGRVQVTAHDGQALAFCSLRCAEIWHHHQPAPLAIHVVDEVTGELIEASRAIIVRSVMPSPAGTGDTLHIFQHRSDAQRHAEAFSGTVLTGADRPYSWMQNPARGDPE
ncbi:MAG: hypothetical protein U0840_00335 [Gemmataceae bacterium]